MDYEVKKMRMGLSYLLITVMMWAGVPVALGGPIELTGEPWPQMMDSIKQLSPEADFPDLFTEPDEKTDTLFSGSVRINKPFDAFDPEK